MKTLLLLAAYCWFYPLFIVSSERVEKCGLLDFDPQAMSLLTLSQDYYIYTDVPVPPCEDAVLNYVNYCYSYPVAGSGTVEVGGVYLLNHESQFVHVIIGYQSLSTDVSSCQGSTFTNGGNTLCCVSQRLTFSPKLVIMSRRKSYDFGLRVFRNSYSISLGYNDRQYRASGYTPVFITTTLSSQVGNNGQPESLLLPLVSFSENDTSSFQPPQVCPTLTPSTEVHCGGQPSLTTQDVTSSGERTTSTTTAARTSSDVAMDKTTSKVLEQTSSLTPVTVTHPDIVTTEEPTDEASFDIPRNTSSQQPSSSDTDLGIISFLATTSVVFFLIAVSLILVFCFLYSNKFKRYEHKHCRRPLAVNENRLESGSLSDNNAYGEELIITEGNAAYGPDKIEENITLTGNEAYGNERDCGFKADGSSTSIIAAANCTTTGKTQDFPVYEPQDFPVYEPQEI